MDGFAEANLLLSTAMQELEELEATMRENGELGSADGQTRAICYSRSYDLHMAQTFLSVS